jgi:hypothetical protein
VTPEQRSTLFTASLVVAFVFGCWFLAVLIGSSPGEAA